MAHRQTLARHQDEMGEAKMTPEEAFCAAVNSAEVDCTRFEHFKNLTKQEDRDYELRRLLAAAEDVKEAAEQLLREYK